MIDADWLGSLFRYIGGINPALRRYRFCWQGLAQLAHHRSEPQQQ
jgi:hypothetical protein